MQVNDFLHDHPWLVRLAVVIGVLAVIVTAAHADECRYTNDGHMICGAAPYGVRAR